MNSCIKTSVVLFGIIEKFSGNYRKLSSKSLSVLLVKKGNKYVLPSYECSELIDVETQAYKVISEECGLNDVYVEQLYTFSKVKDDVLLINPSFLGLVSKSQMWEGLKDSCFWCEFKIGEGKDGYLCELVNEFESFKFEVSKELKEHTTDRYKFYEVDNGTIKEE